MKKVINYSDYSESRNQQSKLYEGQKKSNNSSKRIVESYDVDDFKELYTDRDIANVLMRAANAGSVILIAQERGNQILPTIEAACDRLDIEAASISCRSIRENRNLIEDLYSAAEDLILITDLEIADSRMLGDLISYVEEKGEETAVVFTTSNAEAILRNPVLADIFTELYYYVPRYDRVSYDDDMNESVSQRFSKYRKLYEEDDAMNEDDDNAEEVSDETADDTDKSVEDNVENDEEASDEPAEDDETVDVPMTAVVLTVKKDDADKCKDELIEAGIPEENIEIIEGEEDDEDSQIKVDADSVKELKDYLAGKGIDLEEKIGGEIIDDEESSEEGGEDEENKESSEEGGEDEFNFDEEFGDMFGDDEESSDEK